MLAIFSVVRDVISLSILHSCLLVITEIQALFLCTTDMVVEMVVKLLEKRSVRILRISSAFYIIFSLFVMDSFVLLLDFTTFL